MVPDVCKQPAPQVWTDAPLPHTRTRLLVPRGKTWGYPDRHEAFPVWPILSHILSVLTDKPLAVMTRATGFPYRKELSLTTMHRHHK